MYKPTNSVLTENITGVASQTNNSGGEVYIHSIIQSYKSGNVYTADKNELREKLKKIQEKLGDAVPKDFICPLTQEILVDPVTTSDGTTFERFVISKILTRLGSKCPIKGNYLESATTIPNVIMRKIIADFANNIKIEMI
jgi:hypothetical protein